MYKEDSIEKEEEEDGGDEQSKGFQVEPSLIMAWCNLRRHALPVCCYQNGQGWRRRCNVACIRLESRVSKGIARGRPGFNPSQYSPLCLTLSREVERRNNDQLPDLLLHLTLLAGFEPV
jgi:hypothetical protein